MANKPVIIELNNEPDYQRLLAGAPQTCGMRSGRVYLKAGDCCGVHSTEQHEELLVFLAGAGIAYIGDEKKPYPVSVGKISYIPPHTVHNIENTGSEPLIYIYCVAPAKTE